MRYDLSAGTWGQAQKNWSRITLRAPPTRWSALTSTGTEVQHKRKKAGDKRTVQMPPISIRGSLNCWAYYTTFGAAPALVDFSFCDITPGNLHKITNNGQDGDCNLSTACFHRPVPHKNLQTQLSGTRFRQEIIYRLKLSTGRHIAYARLLHFYR